ncbi:hypothetical protein RI129_006942 [Pyrocoelia pectoralis]|uniref:Uncharacterized protein n=1 Tax=Pyrocoelia pectoralis TaxID=417401 RepID=A0AAN7ZGN8_9COLE
MVYEENEIITDFRGPLLNLPLKKLRVGVNRGFKLNAYFEDVDNLKGDVNFQWTCRNEKNQNCPNFKSTNSTYIEDYKFSAVGSYTIHVLAEKSSVKVSDSVEISVIGDGFVGIEVDDFATPVDPSKEIVVPVYVNGLVSGCTLKWSCLNLPGYGFVDLTKVPGHVNVQTNITLKGNEFLNEIDEYSNDTLDKDYNLLLSKPKDSWPGLGSDTTYLFRLNVTCPVADHSDSAAEQVLRHVTVTADISLSTSPIPILSTLTVSPIQGVALTTNFHFHSNGNVDVVKGTPYLYKFGYFSNNQAIFVSNVLDERSWNSVLPYIDKGVHTVLECCNTYAMCSQVNGTTVMTSLTTFSEKERRQLKIKQMIERGEYYKAFSHATSILLTYKGLKDKALITSFENFISEMATAEIKRLLQLSDGDNETWRISGSNFIRDVGLILDQISSDELLNSVVSLRNKLSKKKDVEYLSKLIGIPAINGFHHHHHHHHLRSLIRNKRETDRITVEEVKSYLVISELIITTSTDKKKVQQEKEHLVKQVDKFMVQLCAALYEKPQTVNLDLKTVSLALEKLNKNKINSYFNILRETNPWNVNGKIKLGKCFTENLSFTNHLCMGKAIFKDYFNKTSFVYMVKVYGTKHSEQVKIQDMICEAVLVLPVDKYDPLESEAKCALWRNKWDQSECKALQTPSKTIQCQCSHLGYYALEYNHIITTTTATVTTTTQKITVTTQKHHTESTEVTNPKSTTSESTQSSRLTSESVTTATVPTDSPTTTELSTTRSTAVVETQPTITEKTTDDSNIPKPTATPAENKTEIDIRERLAEVEYETVCYIIIGISVIGTCTLLYGLKRIISSNGKVYEDDSDSLKYEKLHDEELLDDFSLSNKSLSC